MKRVYLGNKELTTIATRDSAGGGGGDDTQKWVDYFNGTLTEFTVPEGVTKIKDSAFNGCSSLTSITIPNSVVTIGDIAFEGCSDLTSIDIPDSVTEIGYYAFEDCSSLNSITIPKSVTIINEGAFGGCSSLTNITVKATTPPSLGNDAFDNSGIQTIYVPSASVDTYKAANGWKNYADKIQAIPS